MKHLRYLRLKYLWLVMFMTGCATSTNEAGEVLYWPWPDPSFMLIVTVTYAAIYATYRWVSQMPRGYTFFINPGTHATYSVTVQAPNGTQLPRSWGEFDSIWMPFTKVMAAHKSRTHKKFGKEMMDEQT